MWFQLYRNCGVVSMAELITEHPFSGSFFTGWLMNMNHQVRCAVTACLFVFWALGFASKVAVIGALWKMGTKVKPVNLLIMVDLIINLVYRQVIPCVCIMIIHIYMV